MAIFRFVGDKLFQNKLMKLGKYASNKKVLNKQIMVDLVREVDITFKIRGKGEEYQGVKWKPISPITKARRRKGTSTNPEASDKILQDYGFLRESFFPSKPGTRTKYDNNQVVIGTDIEYAKYHEFGMGRNPTRKMLPTEERAKNIALKRGHLFVNDIKVKSGL